MARMRCDVRMTHCLRRVEIQTAPNRPLARHALLATTHTNHLDWSLPAHRRGTLRGMDAA